MFIRLCAVAVAVLSVGVGPSHAADTKQGKEAMSSSMSAKGQGCYDRLPPELRAQLVQHESWLSRELAGCRQVANPDACRSKLKADFGTRIRGTLVDIQKVYGGEVRDCVGDTEGSTAANCPQGSEVQKITVPCDHCVGAYGTTGAGTCFLWVCVPAGL